MREEELEIALKVVIVGNGGKILLLRRRLLVTVKWSAR